MGTVAQALWSPRRPPAWLAGIELLSGFATILAIDAAIGANPAAIAVRHAIFGAAAEQLGWLAGRVGLVAPVIETEGSFPGRRDAVPIIDGEHRLFDGARFRLWLAEEAGDAVLLDNAASVFEDWRASLPRPRRDRRLTVSWSSFSANSREWTNAF